MRGQAMITVLYISILGMLIATGAVFALWNNISSATETEVGMLAHTAAESGAENALLKLIRDPTYTGESWVMDAQTVVVASVSGTTTQTILSTATRGTMSQRVIVQVHYNGGVLHIDSWNDVP